MMAIESISSPANGRNPKYISSIQFIPELIVPTNSIQDVIDSSDVIFLAVPSATGKSDYVAGGVTGIGAKPGMGGAGGGGGNTSYSGPNCARK